MQRVPVLIVEDDPLNLKLVRLVLEDEGVEVRCAANAEQTLEALAKLSPRLILMDLQLPGTDGLVLTRLLRAAPGLGGTWIVALSAHSGRSSRAAALAAGCDDYICKPIDTWSLPRVVKGYLDREREPALRR